MFDWTFLNTGVVTRDMVFAKAVKECFYIETDHEFFRREDFDYLFEVRNGEYVDPPSGMRSSVPLGGLGAGTVELRADGRFMDWNIFNNSPCTGNAKVQLNTAFMGLRLQTPGKNADGNPAYAATLRTHPPEKLPAVGRMEYSGAFPVSRLRISDDDLPVDARLFAYSEVKIRDAERSASPCALFTLELHNPTANAVDASFLFNLPNHSRGAVRGGEQLIFSRDGDGPVGGDMTLAAEGADRVTSCAADTLSGIWEPFAENGCLDLAAESAGGPDEIEPSNGKSARLAFGALCAQARIEAGQTRRITVALAWYFPERPHLVEIIGNYYTHLFENSMDVARTALGRLSETHANIEEWHRSCTDNTLPEWLKDSLVNSLGTMYKTSVWTRDGRFRQFESFSCADIDAIHIHFARSLVYELFYPDLKKNLFTMIAEQQRDDGYIYEQYCKKRQPGHWDPGKLDEAFGRINGDSVTIFALGVYMTWKWTGDSDFNTRMWPHVKRAAEWQLERSLRLGLPDHLVSTYDLSDFRKRDLVSYNAFMHLAGILASAELARIAGDGEFEDRCRKNLERARYVLKERLWTGSYFRNWWSAGVPEDNSIHADTLYGQLWSFLLNLDTQVDPDMLRSHLQKELEYSDSPFGLEVITNPEQPRNSAEHHINDTVWQVGGIDWSALSLYLDVDVAQSCDPARKIVNHWRERLCDQWNYTDLTAVWDGYPYCNSHYCRQLMFWAIPMALCAQDYSAPEKRLSLSPKGAAPFRLPFFTPEANGVLEADEDGNLRLHMQAGTLELNELIINGRNAGRKIKLRPGEFLNVPVV